MLGCITDIAYFVKQSEGKNEQKSKMKTLQKKRNR